jgi:hypothetical protein
MGTFKRSQAPMHSWIVKRIGAGPLRIVRDEITDTPSERSIVASAHDGP